MRTIPLLTATLTAISLCASAFAAAPVVLADDQGLVTISPSPATVAAPNSATAARANVIFSNFGTADAPCAWGNGWVISGKETSAGIPWQAAVPFTPALPATIKQIRLCLTHLAGENLYKVSLNADAAGLPGPVIRGLLLTKVPSLDDCCLALHTGFGHPALEAGRTYWIVVRSALPKVFDTYGFWSINAAGSLGTIARKSSGDWYLLNDRQIPGLEVLGM